MFVESIMVPFVAFFVLVVLATPCWGSGSVLLLGFDTEGARPSDDSKVDEDERIKESLSALDVITGILEENKTPATFFILGRLLDSAGDEYRKRLDKPYFDIESHTYSHKSMKSCSLAELDDELKQTKALIKKVFGIEAIGIRAPGNYYHGLQGCNERLKILWDNGVRFVGSDGKGPPGNSMPAPFTQPYWYEKEGFPELLENPITGWQCVFLLRTVNFSWEPKPAFPSGEILDALPKTVDEEIAVFRKEFQYAIDNGLVYSPDFHPWSLYRFDKEVAVIRFLIEMAKDNDVPIKSFKEYYLDSVQAKHHSK